MFVEHDKLNMLKFTLKNRIQIHMQLCEAWNAAQGQSICLWENSEYDDPQGLLTWLRNTIKRRHPNIQVVNQVGMKILTCKL